MSVNSAPAYRIRFKALTPLRGKIAEALGFAIAITGGYGLYDVLTARPDISTDISIASAAGFLFTYPLWQALARWALVRTTRLTLTLDRIRVRRWFRWDEYDRTLPHSFALLRHDKTRQEERDNEFRVRLAQAEGEVIQPREWYGRSLHLALDYVGHRIDIAEIYGARKAQAVLARLNAVDALLDRQLHHTAGLALASADDWGPEPGEV